ncbi:hypothetical protein [Alteriqipengyuania lutimaris]|uniref:Uncharacterized protein n=1 Tax=Alteriqipengyuania lutimaris TaxID=1538146 RepID=A0A395LLX6_9SPHN|nr:hypothetical protein [Alteriqipengyuania lutimaris]MBB3033185.1 hypothetical protein [Alteriqipengyuania lutimaris]RDS77765.1 hypothetical protein DL238_09205 [Alteriqipengyuania lutimaris]
MNASRLALAPTAALATALALSACASAPEKDYPSLALRDAERATGQYPQPTGDCLGDADGDSAAPVQGTLQPAPSAPPAPPPPGLSNDLAERVAQLEAQARAADADFEAALPAARAAVRARGSTGSKSWGRAEVAYANLRSIRARTAIPLADLDTLVATRSVAGEPVAPIVDTRDEVARLIEQQDAALAELAPR